MKIPVGASDEGGSFEQVPVGEHKAICYKMVDAGTRDDKNVNGDIVKKHSLFVFWELPECQTADGKAMSIFKEYNVSLDERSNLYKDVCAWRNRDFSDEEKKGFDTSVLLGKGCKLNVGRTSGDKAKVKSVHSTPKAFDEDENLRQLPTQNELVEFDLDSFCNEHRNKSDAHSKKQCDILETLPWFMKDKIIGNDEGTEVIPPCFEVLAAIEEGKRSGSEPPSGPSNDSDNTDDFEDDIPF